jgi:hypothetical protein
VVSSPAGQAMSMASSQLPPRSSGQPPLPDRLRDALLAARRGLDHGEWHPSSADERVAGGVWAALRPPLTEVLPVLDARVQRVLAAPAVLRAAAGDPGVSVPLAEVMRAAADEVAAVEDLLDSVAAPLLAQRLDHDALLAELGEAGWALVVAESWLGAALDLVYPIGAAEPGR